MFIFSQFTVIKNSSYYSLCHLFKFELFAVSNTCLKINIEEKFSTIGHKLRIEMLIHPCYVKLKFLVYPLFNITIFVLTFQ